MGEYATWTGLWTGVSVILGLGLGWMNLNHFTGKSSTPTSVADFSKHAPRVWGSQKVREVGLTILTCTWVIGTNLLHQGEVLGLIAMGCHQVMSTLRIEGVITGS